MWDKEKYLSWMYENLMAIKSVMSEKASIYVHLDWHIGHYVKILMDEIFGEDNFRNEIIWQRANAHSDSKQGAVHFGRMHDVIFYYALSDDSPFNMQYTPYDEAYINQYYKSIEPETGRRYWLDNLQGPGGASKGNPYYEVMGISRYWRYSQERMNSLIAEGRIIQTSPGTVPKYKRYLDEMPGKPVQDMWMDVKSLGGLGSIVDERTDYSTQKPIALLERIVSASSDSGMLVADFFGGSGVTAAVAHKLGRRFIHCDIGINSIQTARDRLKTDGAEFDVLEVKDGVQLYRNPVQTMDKIKSLIPGLHSEESLDPFWAGAISDSRLGTVPVYIPNLMDSTSKLLDTVLINRVIHQAIPELDASVKKVILYYIDISGLAEIQKFIAEDDSTSVEIELRDLKNVLDDVVIGDHAEFHTEQTAEGFFDGCTVTIDRFVSDRVLGKIMEYNNKARLNAKKTFKPIEISEEGLELIEFLSVDCTAVEGEWHSDSEIKIDKLGYVIRNGNKTKEFWDGCIRVDQQPLRLKIRNICGDETVWKV